MIYSTHTQSPEIVYHLFSFLFFMIMSFSIKFFFFFSRETTLLPSSFPAITSQTKSHRTKTHILHIFRAHVKPMRQNVVNEKNRHLNRWRVFSASGIDKIGKKKKKRPKTSAQTQSRRARREIDDMSTDTDTQRVTHNTLDVT